MTVGVVGNFPTLNLEGDSFGKGEANSSRGVTTIFSNDPETVELKTRVFVGAPRGSSGTSQILIRVT